MELEAALLPVAPSINAMEHAIAAVDVSQRFETPVSMLLCILSLVIAHFGSSAAVNSTYNSRIP